MSGSAAAGRSVLQSTAGEESSTSTCRRSEIPNLPRHLSRKLDPDNRRPWVVHGRDEATGGDSGVAVWTAVIGTTNPGQALATTRTKSATAIAIAITAT